MAYCTQQDVEDAAGGPERLLQLADWDNDGAVDATRIDGIIAKVSRWVDTFARSRHSVPFAEPAPSELAELVASEVVYRMRKDRGAITDDDRDDHTERITWLKDLAAGRVRIALESEKPKQAAGPETGELGSATGEYDSPDFGGLW